MYSKFEVSGVCTSTTPSRGDLLHGPAFMDARAAPGAAENSRPTPRDPTASLSGRRSVVQDRLARLLRAAG